MSTMPRALIRPRHIVLDGLVHREDVPYNFHSDGTRMNSRWTYLLCVEEGVVRLDEVLTKKPVTCLQCLAQ